MLKSFAGGNIFGTTWGDAPATVLCLHGWRRTHADFDPVMAVARSPLGAVGLDLPGFGATPPPPEAWGSDDYARRVADVFDEGLADRVVLVGHSFGGRVALSLCQQVPARIERLVLCGVPLLPRSDRRARVALTYRTGRRLRAMGLLSETRMEALRQRYGSPDYRAATGVMRDVFVRVLGEDYRAAMAAVSCPVDLLWGADDTETPVEVAERALGCFPSSSLTVLPGVGHLVPTEAPADLARLVAGGDPARPDPTPTSTPDPATGSDGAPAGPMTGSRPSGGRA